MKRKKFEGNFSYKKDIGKVRIANEDECKVVVNGSGCVLMMVADGMGGHNKGDFASIKTVEILSEMFKEKKTFINAFFASQWLQRSIKNANSRIYNIQDKDPDYKGMGTTLALVLLLKNKIITANCGDSRVYWVKNNDLVQLTEDQTYVNFLLRSGQITEDEVATHPDRHVLTNAIGLFPSISIDFKVYNYSGEKIFICSDGVYNNVKKKDILNVLNTKLSTEDKAQSIISLGNYNGGSDNMSLVIWESFND
ncbi:MAG: Stp1/IreP family PP2C-type Ser/Thr phosphatase [Bacilli bacterium]|nr:Stp1/IreP family PP2C-type Ser/Thr phosphatase [Bacilli bacterium]